jgi:hypothetical protein
VRTILISKEVSGTAFVGPCARRTRLEFSLKYGQLVPVQEG